MDAKEKVSEYVADIERLIRMGYLAADECTFNKIALRHFIRGLTDQQMVLAVGIEDSKTVEVIRAEVVWQNARFKMYHKIRLNDRLSFTEGK